MSQMRRDSPSIETMHDKNDDAEERCFRGYWRARDRGDEAQAARLWDDLAVFNYDRMLGKVAVMVRKMRSLVAADVDEIAQEAYLRSLSMALRFEKRALGQARAAMVKAAYYTVMDWNRARVGEQRHEAGSFDDRHDYGEGVETDYSPYDSQVAGWDADVTSEQVERLMELEHIDAAIERLLNEDMRNVLKLTKIGLESNTIAGTLGLTRDNVDQLRSRGVRRLRKLMTDGADD